MITQYLKDNNLIICPNYLKKDIIEEINNNDNFISYKIMDIEEFKNDYVFSYNKKTILYLMKKLNLKYEIVLEYLEAMYYIDNTIYKSNKLNYLKELKQELINHKLLTFNPIFKKELFNYNIIVYGYDNLETFYINILKDSKFNHIKKNNPLKHHKIYQFNDILDEIAYVCYQIKNKIEAGISIDKIKLIMPGGEYNNKLKQVFNWYHIPISTEDKINIYNINIGKEVLNLIKNNTSLNEIVDLIKTKYPEEHTDVIISILNNYVDFEINDIYELVKYDLKHTYLKTKERSNCIKITNISNLKEDEHIYLLGFNKENYPKIYKDEDFLNDNEKEELLLFTSNNKNINSINELINHLNTNTNLTITYKLKDAFNSYNPTILVKNEKFEIIKEPKYNFNSSNIFNKIYLAKELDNLYRYGINKEELAILKNNYQDINYRSYDNSFTGIKPISFQKTLTKPLTLSYSSIDNYYRCGFRYYLSYVLKLDTSDDDFYMNIGNIFHYVLSKCFSNDFDFDKCFNEEKNKYEFNFSKQILLNKLKEELKYDIKVLKEQLNYTNFNDFLYEKKFTVPVSNSLNKEANFTGIVDKISCLSYKNRTLLSIIDYKTGHLPTNLNNIIYGIGMQLPVYLYLVKRSSLFPNIEIVGFYLQKVINKDMKKTSGKTFDELKTDALKLVGYSIDNEEYLEQFDFTYHDSKLISGLKRKNEGFYAYSKVLNKNQINKIDEIVDKNIKQATEDILSAKFDINPKRIDKDILGCEFCSYKDICYHTEKDYIDLDKRNFIDFLGGDDNA